MKKIEIRGKHQKDKIAKANNPNNSTIIATRDCMQSLPLFLFEYAYQVKLINRLYLDLESNIEYKKECLREIDKKINSYKIQDINKNKYDDDNITQEQTIEKLVCCKLKCHYCNSKMLIFYSISMISQKTILT